MNIRLYKTEDCEEMIKLFGSMQSTCVELYCEKEILDEVSVRLDLRNLTLDVLKEVLSFIKLKYVIILKSNRIVE